VPAKEYPLPRVERSALDLQQLQQSCAHCGLNQLCLPASIGADDLPRLDRVVEVKKLLEREQALYSAGQNFRALYVVRSGSFKTFAADGDGETQILGFHLPGEIMGLDAIAGGRHQCSAEALERSSACEVPYEKIEQIARELPGLQQQLLRVISREVQHDHRHLVMIGRKVAIERLAIFLHSLSQRLQRERRDPHQFVLPMSRRDLANYLGLVIETVSRLFSRLAELGVIEVERKTIRILDPAKLRELTGETAEEDAAARRIM
jgi:CRP/FNR family transcriptional regulator, anaerobic regulatory protein